MSVTIRDVAHRAGVSIATVSRVLNDTCSVREDKRRAVLRAARTLGYEANPAALSLLGKKTGGLGVLLPYVSGEFFAELLDGLDAAAQDHDCFLVVSTSHRHPHEFSAAIRAMDKRVDGLVIMAPELDDQDVAPIIREGRPVVFINTYIEEADVDVLNFDNFGGAYALTRHLFDAGHQRVALIHGAPGAGDARERARGYRAAMAEAGVTDTSSLEFEGDYTQAAGFAVTEAILRLDPRPTAIVAANDYCAAGVLSALAQAHVRVPDEMAVTGFDDVPSARYTVPPLTTVHTPIRDIGYRAIERLVAQTEAHGEWEGRNDRVAAVELVIRGSTRAASDR